MLGFLLGLFFLALLTVVFFLTFSFYCCLLTGCSFSSIFLSLNALVSFIDTKILVGALFYIVFVLVLSNSFTILSFFSLLDLRQVLSFLRIIASFTFWSPICLIIFYSYIYGAIPPFVFLFTYLMWLLRFILYVVLHSELLLDTTKEVIYLVLFISFLKVSIIVVSFLIFFPCFWWIAPILIEFYLWFVEWITPWIPDWLLRFWSRLK